MIVGVERDGAHPMYGKRVVRTKKFYAHDEKNEAKVGDTVAEPVAKRTPLIAAFPKMLFPALVILLGSDRPTYGPGATVTFENVTEVGAGLPVTVDWVPTLNNTLPGNPTVTDS